MFSLTYCIEMVDNFTSCLRHTHLYIHIVKNFRKRINAFNFSTFINILLYDS